MRTAIKVLQVMGGGGGGIKYLINDDFTTDIAAGSVNGTVAEPGPGNRTVVDSGSRLSLASGSLLFAAGGVAGTDPYLSHDLLPRVSGRALYVEHVRDAAPGHTQVGTAVELFTKDFLAYFVSTLELRILSPVATVTGLETMGNNRTYHVLVIEMTSGAMLLLKEAASFPEWTMVYFVPGLTSAARSYLSGLSSSFGKVKMFDLGAPWNVDYGIATSKLDGARADGDTFAHEANCQINFKLVTRADGQQVAVRMQDASNYWRLDVAGDGSLALQEVNDGTPTSRATAAAGSVVNGQTITLILKGTTIVVRAVNVVKITYTSASSFSGAAGGKILALGVGGAISDIVAMPREISGAALTALNFI